MHAFPAPGFTLSLDAEPRGLRACIRRTDGSEAAALLPWGWICDAIETPPDRYGVVLDGRLVVIEDNERLAADRAAEARLAGCEARVIRIPPNPTI